MEVSAKVISEYVKGEIVGDAEVLVSSVAKIEKGQKGNICFLANPKYEHHIYNSKASIILINKSFELKQEIEPTIIKVDNAYEAVASLLGLLNTLKAKKKKGIALRARVAFSAKVKRGAYVGDFSFVGKKSKVGKGSQIYPQVYIGNSVEIGENVTIYPGVRVMDGCKVGDNTIIQAGAVIGSDGFGFAPTADGTYKKIPQTGIVIIGENCEIGANTVIDRATMGETIIAKGVKLDNLIQVAHNVVIGSNTVIAAQSGIAGSAIVGENCMFGGQVGISGHITIADETKIAAQSGVMGSIKDKGQAFMGYPAINLREYLRAYSIFRKSAKK